MQAKVLDKLRNTMHRTQQPSVQFLEYACPFSMVVDHVDFPYVHVVLINWDTLGGTARAL